MQYVYVAIGAIIFGESLTILILSKICKKRKIAKENAEQNVETWKSMYERQEQKFKDLVFTMEKVKEARREKIDIDKMSDTDITNALYN